MKLFKCSLGELQDFLHSYFESWDEPNYTGQGYTLVSHVQDLAKELGFEESLSNPFSIYLQKSGLKSTASLSLLEQALLSHPFYTKKETLCLEDGRKALVYPKLRFKERFPNKFTPLKRPKERFLIEYFIEKNIELASRHSCLLFDDLIAHFHRSGLRQPTQKLELTRMLYNKYPYFCLPKKKVF